MEILMLYMTCVQQLNGKNGMEEVIQLSLAFILRNNPILRKHVENRTSRNK
jgi:hypothetical protein